MVAMEVLRSLHAEGQSVWVDFIRRGFVANGDFADLVANGVTGVTSNPTIFEKAIDDTDDYADELDAAARTPSLSPGDVYEKLASKDVRDAADLLRPVYEATAARDGYASLEVSPHLAYDTAATIAEARRLWESLKRPNVMIKVPATPAGQLAVSRLIEAGINVNVTLLFAQETYEGIAEAYLQGLEARLRSGAKLETIASVASFFVSRIDTRVDEQLKRRTEARNAEARTTEPQDVAAFGGADDPRAFAGKVAIANAKMAYQTYQRIFAGRRWEALRAHGAHTQRLLWASTSTKNPAYPDLLYVEQLIGRDTINTVPLPTLSALRDHGQVKPTLESGLPEAQATLAALDAFGISLPRICDELVRDGVADFAKSFDKVLATIERGRMRRSQQRPNAENAAPRQGSSP